MCGSTVLPTLPASTATCPTFVPVTGVAGPGAGERHVSSHQQETGGASLESVSTRSWATGQPASPGFESCCAA